MDESGYQFMDNYSENHQVFRRPTSLNNRYCLSDTIVILFCIKGHAKFNIRFKDYELTVNSFIAIGPSTPFYKADSGKADVDIITISDSVFEKNVQGHIKVYFSKILHGSPLQMMPENKAEMLHAIHMHLKNYYGESNFFKKQITKAYLDIIFSEMCNIMLRNSMTDIEKLTRRDEIARSFISLLEKNNGVKKTVQYYAEEIHLSPKYLSAMVYEATGRKASEWIDDYTVLEARRLLKNTGMTIQNISYDLGFSTPSHFTKFMKEKTGLTPKEIRKTGDL